MTIFLILAALGAFIMFPVAVTRGAIGLIEVAAVGSFVTLVVGVFALMLMMM